MQPTRLPAAGTGTKLKRYKNIYRDGHQAPRHTEGGNVIKLRHLISNTESRLLNIEVKTPASEIQYSLFDI